MELKKTLDDIDEKFFEKIAKDEADQEVIRARGNNFMEADEGASPVKQESAAYKVVIINFAEGDYTVTNMNSNAVHNFKVEAGGILTSDLVNGTV